MVFAGGSSVSGATSRLEGEVASCLGALLRPDRLRFVHDFASC